MFNLATFTKTAKRYAFNPTESNEAFLNKLLEPYVVAGRVTARGGAEFHLDKYRTSKLLSGNADVPNALRAVELQHGLEQRVSKECMVLWDETLNSLYFEELARDVLGLIDSNNRKEAPLKDRLESALDDPCLFLARALIGVVGLENKSQSKGIIWKRGTGSLEWTACDLFRFAFASRRKRKNLVAIPVDCSFKTHVARSYEAADADGVSENTVHGKWLIRMAQSGILESDLKNHLADALKSTEKTEDGAYPIGSIAVLETYKCVFLLLAISHFDGNGNAQSTQQDIASAIESLLRHYDTHGQGADLYLPLLGTGLSRAGLSNAESYKLLVDAATSGASHISGKVTIVVLPEVADELGLAR